MTESSGKRPSAAERLQGFGAAALGRGGRMSRQRKREAVLRLLRGEDLETVSRSLGVTAATLSSWREAFLAGGEASLSTRPMDGEALESDRLKARLGKIRSHRTSAMGSRLLERAFLEAKTALLEARDAGRRAASPACSRSSPQSSRSPPIATRDPPRAPSPSGPHANVSRPSIFLRWAFVRPPPRTLCQKGMIPAGL